MATAAIKGALSTIADTPEEQESLRELKASREALLSALFNRQQLFDPTLLAMAQGFLAPTRAGSFGESLANVAAQVGPVQEREQKQAIEMAQIRAELAAQQMAEAQATRGERRAQDLLRRARGEAPVTQAAQAAQPISGQETPAATSGAPSGQPPSAQPGTGLGGLRNLDPLDIAELSRLPGQEKFAQTLMDIVKLDKDRFKMENRVLYDMYSVDASGRPRILADLGEQKPYEITFKGKGRSVTGTALEVQEYRDAQARGAEAEEQAFNRLFKGRRTGVEAMPFGGERGMFSVRIPDPANPTQLLTLTGEATARQRAMLEQAEEKAFETGDFADLRRIYTQVTGQGQYTARPPAAAPTAPAAPGVVPSARVAPGEQAARDVDRRRIVGNELSEASQRMADAIRDNNPDEERKARADIASLRREVSSAQGLPAGLAVDPELASLPISEQVKITVDRVKASEKEANDQMSLIRQVGAPTQVEASDRRNQEILRLARENPKVFNLMAKQGLFTALAAAANEGFKVGQYSVSAPAQTFLQKLKLSPEEQAVARRVTMLLDEEFFNRAVYNKTVLGPQISNADATLMKSPMARPEDSAKIIAYWAQHALLTNRQARDLYNAAMKYPANRSPKYFIGEDAANIMSAYTPRYQVLQRQFSVGGE